MSKPPLKVRTWANLSAAISKLYTAPDYKTGTTNAHAIIRSPSDSPNAHGKLPWKVTLYRDNHAWCPYCQKVWLFLEEKRVSYEIKKVTMFCYGEKEAWYKKIVPRGMLPALEIENTKTGLQKIITESDVVLEVLEDIFGTLGNAKKGSSLFDEEVIKNRRLERKLFSAWCSWLCRPSYSSQAEEKAKFNFQSVCYELENRIKETAGPYLLDEFGISDTIITPYIERMQSSLYYYKGFNMRKEHPIINDWFTAMESRNCYRGTKSDHHTHVHDLPPQMGGCFYAYGFDPLIRPSNGKISTCISEIDQIGKNKIFPEYEVDETSFPEPENSRLEAVFRVLKHRENVAKINPIQGEPFDVALRAVLTMMIEKYLSDEEVEQLFNLPKKSALALLFIRDRLSVPRDMSFWAGRRFREALGYVAEFYGDPADLAEYHNKNAPGNESINRWSIPTDHRLDTDPKRFKE